MSGLAIQEVRAREILDSRGRPTVEADVRLADGAFGRASVPSGASTGRHEAVELRDGDPTRYRGRGVLRAVEHVNAVIGPSVRGRRADDQGAIDAALLELDGTPNRARLGANAILAVSLAACRAASAARGVPLYRHIADLADVAPRVPLPMVNIISGGLHAGGQLDIQDVLVVPRGARSFRTALEVAVEVHALVGDRVVAAGFPALGADEGGWGPALASNREAISWVAEAIAEGGFDAAIALDVAASQFRDGAAGTYAIADAPAPVDSDGLIEVMRGWVADFPVISIEDGLGEDDDAGWSNLSRALSHIQLVGDDLLVTNADRLRAAIAAGTANAVLVKPNQAGTLSQALDVIRIAREAGYATIVSARSGETEDSFIADLAVGSGAGQLKVGSVTRSSRLAKWNQVLRIEEELGVDAYVGDDPIRSGGAPRARAARIDQS